MCKKDVVELTEGDIEIKVVSEYQVRQFERYKVITVDQGSILNTIHLVSMKLCLFPIIDRRWW